MTEHDTESGRATAVTRIVRDLDSDSSIWSRDRADRLIEATLDPQIDTRPNHEPNQNPSEPMIDAPAITILVALALTLGCSIGALISQLRIAL